MRMNKNVGIIGLALAFSAMSCSQDNPQRMGYEPSKELRNLSPGTSSQGASLGGNFGVVINDAVEGKPVLQVMYPSGSNYVQDIVLPAPPKSSPPMISAGGRAFTVAVDSLTDPYGKTVLGFTSNGSSTGSDELRGVSHLLLASGRDQATRLLWTPYVFQEGEDECIGGKIMTAEFVSDQKIGDSKTIYCSTIETQEHWFPVAFSYLGNVTVAGLVQVGESDAQRVGVLVANATSSEVIVLDKHPEATHRFSINGVGTTLLRNFYVVWSSYDERTPQTRETYLSYFTYDDLERGQFTEVGTRRHFKSPVSQVIRDDVRKAFVGVDYNPKSGVAVLRRFSSEGGAPAESIQLFQEGLVDGAAPQLVWNGQNDIGIFGVRGDPSETGKTIAFYQRVTWVNPQK